MGAELKNILVEDLDFDKENPRLPVSKKSEVDSEVINYMIRHETLFDIVSSIAAQGYFEGEPLLVVASGNRYIVAEGNRRLAALKLLNDPSLATERPNAAAQLAANAKVPPPQEVPCMVFSHRDKIIDYLGYRHITGIDDWDSLQKARFLVQLADRHRTEIPDTVLLYRHLANLIGSSSSYVKKLIQGFTLYKEIEDNNFYEIDTLSEAKFPFSVLTTAVSYENIRNLIQYDNVTDDFNRSRLKQLTKFLFEPAENGQPRIPESRSLKSFNAVAGNKVAFQKFVEGASLDVAIIHTDEPGESLEKSLRKSYQFIRTAHDTIHQVQTFSNSKGILDLLDSVNRLSKDMTVLIRARLEE